MFGNIDSKVLLFYLVPSGGSRRDGCASDGSFGQVPSG